MKKTLFCFCLLLFGMKLLGQTPIAPSAGDGSEGNPYQIANLENLYWMATDTSGCATDYYIQTADIDASPTENWLGGKGWMPINFNGFYNGQGHIIDHLYIDRFDSDYVGLFATAGDVINLRLTNAYITGKSYVGSLIGFKGSCTYINNCHSSGTVRGVSDVGGLVGWSQSSMIMNSSYNGIVIGINLGDSVLSTNIGGLAGANGMGSISYSYSKGSVSGHTSVGGLTGSNWGTVSNSYSTANVSGYEGVGGLSGSSVGSGYSQSTTENSFCTGSVSGTTQLGGLTGTIDSLYSSFTNSFWNIETSGLSTSEGGTGKTTAELKTQTTFTDVGWDFMNIWAMNETVNYAYPHLIWQIHPEPSVQTLPVDEITSSSARVSFQISIFGLPYREIDPYIKAGFCCSDSLNPTHDASWYRTQDDIYSIGSYNSVLDFLEPNKEYYVYAFATNIMGTVYGDTLTFTTLETSLNEMIPNNYCLLQNYPNPWNPTTTLEYGLPQTSDIALNIYDIAGRKVKEWTVSNQQPGWYEVIWDGTDQSGSIVSTGVYIYSLRASNFFDTKKMVFMK